MALVSEAKRQKLSTAGGVAVHQSAKADLMGDTGARQAFGDDADHDSQHGGAAIEQFHPLELIPMDLLFCPVAEPGVVGWGVGHRSVGGCDGD